MNYNTREKIEQFCKDEFDLSPYDEKTIRMMELVEFVINDIGADYDDLEEQFEQGYSDGLNDNTKYKELKSAIDNIRDIIDDIE